MGFGGGAASLLGNADTFAGVSAPSSGHSPDLARQPGVMSRLDFGLHFVELATNFRFDEMRELARAGLGEMDPVGGAQLHGLAVDVGTERAVVPASSAKASHTSI